MIGILDQQADYLSLVFGLSLLSLAALCFSLRGRDQRLPWLWLGLFALTRGLVSWLEVPATEADPSPPLRAVHCCLIVISCLTLAEFARAGLSMVRGRGPGRWVLFPILLALAGAGWRGPEALQIVSDLALLPGEALLAAWVVWQAARADRPPDRWLALGGAALGVYGVSALLLGALPALGAWSAPAPVGMLLLYTATVAAGALAVAVCWERDWSRQRDAHYVRGRVGVTLGIALAILAILVLGWLVTQQFGRVEDGYARHNLLARAVSAAATLSPEWVGALARAQEIGRDPSYDLVRAHLRRLREANPDCRFVYLMAMRRGEVVFCADAEPENSPAFSPPGQLYPEASEQLRALFAGGPAFVEGPLRDRWGDWVSGLAPIRDPRTQRVLAVLGMDLQAADLTEDVARARLSGLIITGAAFVLVIGFFVSFQRFADFTARLGDSERSYGVLLDSSPNAILLVDGNGQVLSVNRYGLETMGREKTEVEGRPFVELFCPPARPRAQEVLATVLAGRPAQMEATCARPDGTLVTWQVMANPLFDEEGQVRRFVAIAVDISERKRAEQVLSETIARLTAVNEIARAVASTLDQDSVMRIVLREVQRVVPSDGMCLIMAEPGGRRARIIGTQGDMAGDPRLGPGEYLDMSFLALDEVILQGRQVYRPDMRSLTQPVFIRLLESGLLSSVSVPIVSDHLPLGCLIVGRSQVDAFDQRELELLQSLAPHLAAAIKNAQAYDQLRTARAELQKAQEQMIRTERLRSIGEVAGGVAHDFNNLLGVILSRTQVLLQQCQDPQTQLSLQAVEKAARDGRDTVKRIQQFVGRHSEEGQVVADLDEIVKGALHLTAYRWKDQAEREGLPLVMQVDLGAAPLVRVNPVEIREVLVNLILNACDALPAGGQITVRTGASAGSGWLQVTDNGIGMDDATVPQVFDLFFTTKGENNTGLGLAVSEGIVQRHGGRIEVESRLGQGTTFTVSLPLADGPPGEQEAEVSDTRPAESLQVLVVDDDPMVLGAMQEALDTLGYATRGAADGRAAVALAQQQRFDVVVTDLGMPGMSGWQVAEEIKRLSPQTQVMILTGWGDTIEPTRFVDETLTKPVELSALREVMVRAAARKAA